MEQNKAEILSELYAIRATMSLVAQNEDKTQESKKSIDSKKAQNKKLNKSITAKQDEIDREIQSLKCETVLDTCKKDFQEVKDHIVEMTLGISSIILFICLIIAGVALFFTVGFFAEWEFYDMGIGWNRFIQNPIAISIIVGIVLIPTLITFFSVLIANRDDFSYLRDAKRTRKKADEQLNAGHTYVDEAKGASLEKAVEEYEAERERAAVVLETEVSQYRLLSANLKEESRALVHSATEAYPVIDFRDWGNVDLLIYYFETGRADDVKEALQLVDRQLQTDQITRAIETASQEIQRTVKDSVYRLGQTMVKCFERLSRQMAAQHQEAMTSQIMTNALLSQIATKSTDLYVQVNAQVS